MEISNFYFYTRNLQSSLDSVFSVSDLYVRCLAGTLLGHIQAECILFRRYVRVNNCSVYNLYFAGAGNMTGYYLNMSLFLAYATLFPEQEFLIFSYCR